MQISKLWKRSIKRSAASKQKIMVVGTFRSGTNLMKHLLETHFETQVTFSEYFWKHAVPPTSANSMPPNHVPIIVLTKDPVRFNESLYEFWKNRRPNLDRGKDLSEFATKPLIVYKHTKGRVAPEYLFSTPTDYWNQFHFSWLHWKDVSSRLAFVNIENLQKNPHDEVSSLAKKFELRRANTTEIALPTQAISPSRDGKATSFAKGETKKREKLTEADIHVVKNLVNSSVAQALGYKGY